MQFSDGLMHLAGECFPLCVEDAPRVLHISLAKRVPELRAVLADLGQALLHSFRHHWPSGNFGSYYSSE